MIEITLDSAIAALKGAVDEKGGEFVYQPRNYDGFSTCYYVHSDHDGDEDRKMLSFESLENVTPGCIAGTALHSLGVPLKELFGLEELDATSVVELLESQGVINAEDGVGSVLRSAQTWQDNGGTWAEAYERALRRYNIAKKSS